MKNPLVPSSCAGKMKFLSDITRLWLLEELLAGPKTASELNAVLKIEQNLLTHHLKVLCHSGLVRSPRDGKAVRYEIAPEAKAEIGGKAIHLGCCRISLDGLPKRKDPPTPPGGGGRMEPTLGRALIP